MKIIAIAGGSGAGKSTVAYALQDSDPAKFEVLNFDDYQRLDNEENLPMLHGQINWDHPDIINWTNLNSDLLKLRDGQEVSLDSWTHRSNKDYFESRQRIARTVQPKDVLIVEGYLCLHDPEINQLYDLKVYLDLDLETRNTRRDKGHLIDSSDKYDEQIQNPMFKKYILPTKPEADLVVDVSTMSIHDVAKQILGAL